MFYEPKTLIIVYKDEMLANQMKKLIETKDNLENEGTEADYNRINVVAWTEDVWLANKKAGNITSKVLFLGDIKGVDKLIPVIDVKFDQYGIRYGWAGNQAVIYATPAEIKSIENYRLFHEALETLPVPQVIKDSIKPRSGFKQEKEISEEVSTIKSFSEEENKGLFVKGKNIAKKVGHTIGEAVVVAGEWALSFSEETFRNKNEMERQMLFFGVVKLYYSGLETFMKS